MGPVCGWLHRNNRIGFHYTRKTRRCRWYSSWEDEKKRRIVNQPQSSESIADRHDKASLAARFASQTVDVSGFFLYLPGCHWPLLLLLLLLLLMMMIALYDVFYCGFRPHLQVQAVVHRSRPMTDDRHLHAFRFRPNRASPDAVFVVNGICEIIPKIFDDDDDETAWRHHDDEELSSNYR